MGASMTSGGMGKNELSLNEIAPSATGARGLVASLSIQSYSFLNIQMALQFVSCHLARVVWRIHEW